MYLGWNFKSRSSAWKLSTKNQSIAISGNDFWRDSAGNIYASRGLYQYKYNKNNYKWETVTWNIYIERGRYVWYDPYYQDVNYSDGANQYRLNEQTNTWEEVEWELVDGSQYVPYTFDFNGYLMWVYSNGVYYSDNGVSQTGVNKQYKRFGKNVWMEVTYGGNIIPQAGSYIWRGEDNVYYYSHGNQQYELTVSNGTLTWTTKTWTNVPTEGINIWRDPYLKKTYYSDWLGRGANAKQYEFNATTHDFDLKTWDTTLTSGYGPQGYGIWTIDGHVFCNEADYVVGSNQATELI